MIKTCLITGGAGFIGSHLAEKLIALGYHVLAIDDFSQGSYLNIAHLLTHPQFNFTEVDITSEAFAHTLTSFEVDYIFHLASPVGVSLVMNSSFEVFDKHETASHILFSWAAKHNTPIFFASSSEVYGNSFQTNMLKESDAKPLTWFKEQSERFYYGKLKRSIELYLEKWSNEHKIPVTIGRFFNIFGERQRSDQGMVMPNFVFSALKNEPLSIYGDGSQIRSFCPVHVAISALLSATIHHTEKTSIILNIGQSIPISIKELAKKVIYFADSTSKIEFIELQENKGRAEGIHTRIPDISILKQLNLLDSTTDWESYLKSWILIEKQILVS